ncbi:MAG: hypothetical protein ACOC9Q_02600 [bacterium]
MLKNAKPDGMVTPIQDSSLNEAIESALALTICRVPASQRFSGASTRPPRRQATPPYPFEIIESIRRETHPQCSGYRSDIPDQLLFSLGRCTCRLRALVLLFVERTRL